MGLLLPTAGRLLTDVGLLVAIRSTWSGADLRWISVLAAAWAVRWGLGAALRSVTLARAARLRGFPAAPWGRPAALLGVELVTSGLSTLAMAAVGVGGALVATELLSAGWIAGAAVVLALATLAAAGGAMLVKAVFATAPMEALVGGRSALGALAASLRAGPVSALTSLILIVAGEGLTGLGALLCGALALPGYPLADLAIAERWLGARRPR